MIDLLKNILQSKGYKRTIASMLAAAAVGAQYVPALAPYQPVIAQVAGWLGALGVAHAAVVVAHK